MSIPHFNKFFLAAWFISGIASLFFFFKKNDFGSYTKWSTYNDLYPENGPAVYELEKWQKCRSQYSEEELKEAKKLSSDEAGIKEDDPVFTKTIKLGQWIINNLWECKTGRPPDSIDRLRPLAIWDAAKSNKTPVWCGTYGALFLFFCTSQNITCRYLESIGKTDGHVVDECYIPELKKWVMVDLTHKIIMAKDSKGNYLNAVDIKNIYRNGLSNMVWVYYVKKNDSATWMPADSANTEWKLYLGEESILRYYHLIYLTMAYKNSEKLKRYFLPVAWYEIYTEAPRYNILFFIRSFITLIWLLMSIFIVLKLFKLKRRA